MKKTPSLFQRNYHGQRELTNDVVPGSEWVLAGEGMATRKYDGSCCMVQGGELFKRYDAKHGRIPPADFIPAQPEADPNTGHWPGWIPVIPGVPASKWHALAWLDSPALPDGTYELIGPKVQGGKEVDLHGGRHVLMPHGAHPLPDAPRDFEGLRAYLTAHPDWEGIVWHHPDGRRVKVTRKGFVRP